MTQSEQSTSNSIAIKRPDLVAQWHPSKNGATHPSQFSCGSNLKIWWQCQYGHEWEATIANRTGKDKTGCPYCSGKKASEHHNLAKSFPELIKDWCYDKNFPLTPETVTPFSHQKVWWRCSNAHEWFIEIASRTKKKSGCPYCAGRKIGVDNSLAVLHPSLAKEWHAEKNGNLTPHDVGPGTDKKVWWICNKGHLWQASVCHRTHNSKATGCPYCSGRSATVENNLAVLFPDLLAEWDYEKNNPLKPEDLKPGSNIKVWWKCINGHEWKTTLNKRTGEGTNCPNCAPQSSRLEVRLFCELKYLFGDEVVWRYKIDRIEVDLYLQKYFVGIELDGFPWHLNKEDKDIAKSKELLKRGIRLFRLRDNKLPKIEDTDIFYGSVEVDWPIIERLVVNLLRHVKFNPDDIVNLNDYVKSGKIQNHLEYQRILSYLPSPPPEYSLANAHSHLICEWNFEKNAPLTPEHFMPSARANVWWKCPNGHEYQSYIYNRIKGVGCPYCTGKKVSVDNSLQSRFPEIAKQWHFEKNYPLTPDRVYHGTHQRVWWKCSQGHEWEINVSKRTSRLSGCPYCSRKLINDDNSLQAVYPEVATQWHPLKNGNLSPTEIAPCSNKKVWWQCDKGHEWETAISSRTGKQKSGCPYCSGNFVSDENNLLVAYPAIVSQWHYEKNSPLTPEKVTPRSSKKYWWVCKNGHEWEAALNNRTRSNATTCPYCAGKFVTATNNFAVKFPDLLNQWDYNKNVAMDPSQLLPGSSIKVWWACYNGHHWQASVQSRTGKKSGCPYCAGQKTASNRNFATEYPELAAQWNFIRNLGKRPDEFSPKSGKKVWWNCENGHEWESVIANRANGTGCPICAGRKK